ncbi:glycoside hydrolase family 5 protein [Dacryopinax primogenitus]|uniref:Glycoside hydrolase family 5 protein n=1 Tax=Dacryopinax primogenitus (strain DJM 731) TaxID=1858805 RepID=M5FYL1_DACPD|nr:glycoside hydrolase family 5 protein [Dacryopinax primogenitus]EJU00965.1 glycoside hydrolase family 5 protein [Dacryopinax primogenitus]
MPASISQLAIGLLCEVFLWQSGVPIANLTQPAQTMQGIGASGAWWPLDLYNYPDAVRQNVSYLLFSSDALGLTSYRYNVGGGGVGVGVPSRAPETTYISTTSSNYSADPQGSYFLHAAAQYSVPQLTVFVNSAPPSFTTSQASCAGALLNSSIPLFGTYLAGVVQYWASQGIHFAYVSPMNEPDNGFPPASGSLSCTQEGMVVVPSVRPTVVQSIRAALDAAGLQSVLVQADETSTQVQFAVEADLWIPGAAGSIAVISHHDYLFAADTALQAMGDQGRYLSGGKQMWFTEICCFVGAENSTDPASALAYGQGYDPTMLSALQMANLIYRSFTLTGDAHFDWWVALSSEMGCSPASDPACATTSNTQGWNDGLIYYDASYASNGNTAIYLTKRYFVLKHFAHAIPLGAVRYVLTPLPAFRLLAFSLPSGGWSVIALNLEPDQALLALDTLQLGTATQAYQTTQDEDWETLRVQNALSCGTVFQMVLPGSSVTSIYFSG